TNGSGFFVIRGAGIAGTFSGTFSIDVPGVSFTGTFGVLVNTTNAVVHEDFAVGATHVVLNLDSGKFVKVTGTNITLAIAGQTLAGDFTLEQKTLADNSTVVTVTFANVSLRLGDGTTDFVRISHGSGVFLLTSAGLAGQASAQVAIDAGTGFSFSGTTFAILINTTNAEVTVPTSVSGL